MDLGENSKNSINYPSFNKKWCPMRHLFPNTGMNNQRHPLPFSGMFDCQVGYHCLGLWLLDPMVSLWLGGPCGLHLYSAWPRSGTALANTLEPLHRYSHCSQVYPSIAWVGSTWDFLSSHGPTHVAYRGKAVTMTRFFCSKRPQVNLV